jgi:hypothetical protein
VSNLAQPPQTEILETLPRATTYCEQRISTGLRETEPFSPAMAQFSGAGGATSANSSPAISHQSHPQSVHSLQAGGAAGTPGGAQQQHKRVYQACIPCRRRKVRCDLGSVDNPNDPPCVRCRRESKECFFSATRRKRKTDDGEASDGDDYMVRNGRKRAHPEDNTPPQIDRRLYSEVPLTPGGSHGRSQPLRRPGEDGVGDDGDDGGGDDTNIAIAIAAPSVKRTRKNNNDAYDDNQQMENPDAQTMMRRGVYGPHDALDLLYKAATDTDRLVRSNPRVDHQLANDNRLNSPANATHKREESRVSMASVQPPLTAVAPDLSRAQSRFNPTPVRSEQPIDPELGKQDLSAQPGYAEAIKAWTRFRFVRAGWFTPHEAIEYID